MANFDARIYTDYTSTYGLVLDCRESDIPAIFGTHTGANNAAVLTDSTKSWTPSSLVGQEIYNTTDGSSSTITANTATTVTGVLAGGVDNDWDTGDDYVITDPDWATTGWVNRAPPSRSQESGTHTGGNNDPTLTDSSQSWRTDELVGKIVYNTTDGSWAVVLTNTATQVFGNLQDGTGNDWDTNDTYVMGSPRFGNIVQDDPTKVPLCFETAGIREAAFDRTLSHVLDGPLEDTALYFPQSSPKGRYAVAYDFAKTADVTNDQVIIGHPNLRIWRRDPAGNFGYRHNLTSVTGAGDRSDGTWMLAWTGAVNASEYLDGVSQLAGSASDVEIDTGILIGSKDGASGFCDMSLRSLQIWDRQLSPLERDFIWDWTDDTGTGGEHRRVNPTLQAPQKFYVAEFPTGGFARIQIAAAVFNGFLVSDSDLGGDLFELVCIEYPVGHPAVFQDAGWSAVWDVKIDEEGHYTFAVYRENGGAFILHLDAEAV
jgi:hypothetical protein